MNVEPVGRKVIVSEGVINSMLSDEFSSGLKDRMLNSPVIGPMQVLGCRNWDSVWVGIERWSSYPLRFCPWDIPDIYRKRRRNP